jgi:DNA-binding NtrC family response regulator/tetratricopeptide (TPR) repeat protein
MKTNLIEKISFTDDKFQFVLEYEELFKTQSLFERNLSIFEQYAADSDNLDDRINIQLGLVFMKRSRSSESTNSLLKSVDNISTAASSDGRLKAKIDVVRAATLLMRSQDYDISSRQLDDLYKRFNRERDHFLFGLVAWHLGIAGLWTANYSKAEETLQDALSVFRRFGHKIYYAYVTNDYGVLKKRMCHYDESARLIKKSFRIFGELGLPTGQLCPCNNLGVVGMRTGDWRTAEYYYDQTDKILQKVLGVRSDSYECVYRYFHTNKEHLFVFQRKFESAEKGLITILNKFVRRNDNKRLVILAREFLGELYTETEKYKQARKYLEIAYQEAQDILPESDVSTEVTRRLAQLYFKMGEMSSAEKMILECLRVCKKIDDDYELGAVLRTLGELRAFQGYKRKAIASFETAIRTLKKIRECYELMRTCIAYGAFLVDNNEPDAELYLMEARQLCRKLEIEFFLGRINVELTRLHLSNDNFVEARSRLAEAEAICDRIQECDQKQLKPLIDRANRDLDARIVKKSMASAQEIKSICRVYEEARFPIEELKPDLAYQVARNVDAASLFLIKRLGRGYKIPLAYNIRKKEAKEIVRRLDRDSKVPLLGVEQNPKVLSAYTGQLIVCVPTNRAAGYILCTCVTGNHSLSPRFFEYLVASAEALGRLAEHEMESIPPSADGFVDGDEKSLVTHPRGSFKDILTIDTEMIKLIRLAERASLSDESILLEGETGVGKELFANAIHANSSRKDRPFVIINAGGMPVNLLESQLFGHVKGAFTDAVTDRIGLIEEADGGTIFLDESGEMGSELQVKLLRLLENGEFRRLGENRVRIARVRVVSATNRDLVKEVERGTFRRDLYYRLGTVKLHIPALRFRQRDIELLLRHFLKECALRNQQTNRHFQIDVKAMEALELYDWPGNIRELQNEIRRIVSLIGKSDLIRFAMLSQPIKDYLRSKNRKNGLLERSVERYERRLILDALNSNDWNRLRTAEKLGIPRTTLLAKMRRLNVAAQQTGSC